MRGSDPLARVNLLEVAPARSARWEEVDGRVVVERPAVAGRGPKALLERLLRALSARRIRLDETGSFVWRQLDGRRTVAEIAERMRERFGDRVEPAEERLGRLIRLLRQENLVVYPGWDEPPPAPW